VKILLALFVLFGANAVPSDISILDLIETEYALQIVGTKHKM
jgi:hypothetical protein